MNKKRHSPDCVVWSQQYGAACPACGRDGRSHLNQKTLPWSGGMRLRYHKCAECGCNFSSLEIDYAQKVAAGREAETTVHK